MVKGYPRLSSLRHDLLQLRVQRPGLRVGSGAPRHVLRTGPHHGVREAATQLVDGQVRRRSGCECCFTVLGVRRPVCLPERPPGLADPPGTTAVDGDGHDLWQMVTAEVVSSAPGAAPRQVPVRHRYVWCGRGSSPVAGAGGSAGVEGLPSTRLYPVVQQLAGPVRFAARWVPRSVVGVEVAGDDDVVTRREGVHGEAIHAFVFLRGSDRGAIHVVDVGCT